MAKIDRVKARQAGYTDAEIDAYEQGNSQTVSTSTNTAKPDIQSFINKASETYNVPVELLQAQINQESGGDPEAVSSAGAVGVSQFIPETARAYGLRVDDEVDERLDPEKAIEAQGRFMSDLYKQYGSWERALSAYNSGDPEAYTDPEFARGETYNYVKNIMGNVTLPTPTSTTPTPPNPEIAPTPSTVPEQPTGPENVVSPFYNENVIRTQKMGEDTDFYGPKGHAGEDFAYIRNSDMGTPTEENRLKTPIGGMALSGYQPGGYGNFSMIVGANPEEYNQMSEEDKQAIIQEFIDKLPTAKNIEELKTTLGKDVVLQGHGDQPSPFYTGDYVATGSANFPEGSTGLSDAPHSHIEWLNRQGKLVPFSLMKKLLGR